MNGDQCKLFALNATREFGQQVARECGLELGEHIEREFEDGEHKARPLENVRDRDVYVIQSLYSDGTQSVNDKLARLLFFLGALRDASADRVTAITPYLCYARKDRKTQTRDPVTTRYVAQLFESVGLDVLVTMDVHNLAAFQNAFRIGTEHLEARLLFAPHFDSLMEEEPIVVISPDAGGMKRAEAFRQSLDRRRDREVPIAFLEKQRSRGVVSGEAVVGEIEGRVAVILDDLISTGTTLSKAADACREHGARKVYAAATHGIFVKDAPEVLSDPALEEVVVTNTIPPFRLEGHGIMDKITVLDTAPLFAEVIKHMHQGGSVVDVLHPSD